MKNQPKDAGKDKVLGRLTITGGVWRVQGVDKEPVVELTQWRAYRLPDGDVHFMGWQEAALQGRVTSAIQEFDPVQRCGRTRSGRVHRLMGGSGYNGDAGYTWSTWLRIYRLESCEDVTEAFEAMLEKGLQ